MNGLFYAALAIIVGSAVIAIGGGGITPMRSQWEKALSKIEQEGPQMRQQAQGSGQRIQQRAQERKEQVADLRERQPFVTPERISTATPRRRTTRWRGVSFVGRNRKGSSGIGIRSEHPAWRAPGG